MSCCVVPPELDCVNKLLRRLLWPAVSPPLTVTSRCNQLPLKIGNDCLQRGKKRWPKDVDWPKREAGRNGVCGAELSRQSLDKANVSVICFRVLLHSEIMLTKLCRLCKCQPICSFLLLFPNQAINTIGIEVSSTEKKQEQSTHSTVQWEGKKYSCGEGFSAPNDHKQQKGAKFSAKTTSH